MDTSTAITRAADVVARVIAPNASAHDKDGTFSSEAVTELGKAGLLGLTLPEDVGGLALGPRAFAGVTAKLSEADPSVGMVYTMHVCATQAIAARHAVTHAPALAAVLAAIGKGTHLTTLGFSEPGSRSHFWAPVSRSQHAANGGVKLNAKKSWVTSAGHAASYVVTTLSPDGKGPTDSTLYFIPADAKGVHVAAPWDGMGLRANASAPMTFEAVDVPAEMRLTDEGTGFKAKLDIVLPWFCLGSAAVALGLCRGTVAATVAHLKSAKFEHMGSVSLGEALPNLRDRLASMQIQTDMLGMLVDNLVASLESPGPETMLRVLEAKAAAGDTAIAVTSTAMRTCGGAAFSKHTGIERYFRDAQAGAVMAPTVDVLHDFIGKALLGIPLF